VTVAVLGAETARAADASQAAYFRASLADERQTVSAQLRQAKARLRACTEHQETVGLRGMARARFRVRDLESQLLELDRMIIALDRRFAPLAAVEH
jgi:hypothetical protein